MAVGVVGHDFAGADAQLVVDEPVDGGAAEHGGVAYLVY
jgi:hypothetical protein